MTVNDLELPPILGKIHSLHMSICGKRTVTTSFVAVNFECPFLHVSTPPGVANTLFTSAMMWTVRKRKTVEVKADK